MLIHFWLQRYFALTRLTKVLNYSATRSPVAASDPGQLNQLRIPGVGFEWSKRSASSGSLNDPITVTDAGVNSAVNGPGKDVSYDGNGADGLSVVSGERTFSRTSRKAFTLSAVQTWRRKRYRRRRSRKNLFPGPAARRPGKYDGYLVGVLYTFFW